MRTIWLPDLTKFQGPKYRALLLAIKDALRAGELEQGEKLPPIREIAWQLHMTPSTVVRAYQLGIDEGILEARVGDGTYIKSTDHHLKHIATITQHFYDAAEQGGYNLRTAAVPRLGQDQLFNQLMSELIGEGGLMVTHYTTNSQVSSLKSCLSNWLATEGINRKPEEILVSKGATNGTAVTANIIARGHGNAKALIEPESYVGFRDLETTGHISLLTVDVDAFGMRPDLLRETCLRERPHFIVTSSIVHNPYAITMSDERMKEIAEVAREFDLQIIDDTIHAHLRKPPWKSFHNFAPERTWTVTSLSKLGYPALQVGIVLPPLERLDEAQDYFIAHNIRLSELQRPITEKLLTSEQFYEVLEKTREEIVIRQGIVREWFADHDIQMAEGAPYFWINLPKDLRVSQVVENLGQVGIRVASADTFSRGVSSKHGMRITLGGPLSRRDFTEAIAKIVELLAHQNIERVV